MKIYMVTYTKHFDWKREIAVWEVLDGGWHRKLKKLWVFRRRNNQAWKWYLKMKRKYKDFGIWCHTPGSVERFN